MILNVYKALVTKSRVNVGHTNSHEWEKYTFAAHSRKNGKITNKIVVHYRNDNNNHNGNNDNKIEIRLKLSNKFLVNCFWKEKRDKKTERKKLLIFMI